MRRPWLNRDLAYHAGVQYRLLKRPSHVPIHGVIVGVDQAWPADLVKGLYRGDYESGEAAVLRATLRPDDRFLEVGAGIGVICAVACQLVGAEHVTSFEASPALVRAAAHTLTANGFYTPVVEHAVLGDDEDPKPFYVRDVFWESSLLPTPGAHHRPGPAG